MWSILIFLLLEVATICADDKFYWGSATSAFQIEGAVDIDGRGPSIWDTFMKLPGKIINNDTADIVSFVAYFL
jgi:beta-glucosidase/6-phospho-beta-glucosidase/beta-galactosidase